MAQPLNALELVQAWQIGQAKQAAMQHQMQMESAMMPYKIEALQANALRDRAAIDYQRNALAAGERRAQEANALKRDAFMSQERRAAQARNAPGKPQWDSARGVWVTPPQAGAQAGASGIIRPEGLPPSATERKAETEEEKEQKRISNAMTKADLVVGKVDEALDQTGFFTTGLIGDIRGTALGRTTGSGAYDLEKTLDTIKANIGFKELQDMREASPTGGALGQVALQELMFLQSALSSLDKGQGEAQLRKNLAQVKKHYENWKKTVTASGAGRSPSGAPRPGTVQDGYRFKGGNPADKANWEKI